MHGSQKVAFKPSDGSKAVPDFVAKGGSVVETKTGVATLSKGQAKLFDDISSGRSVTPVGKNAANAGYKPGNPVTLKSATIDQQ